MYQLRYSLAGGCCLVIAVSGVYVALVEDNVETGRLA